MKKDQVETFPKGRNNSHWANAAACYPAKGLS
jgi:hypothetical protein